MMIETETEVPQPTTSTRTRLPHVAGVVSGILLLAGAVLLWTGQFSGRPANRAAVASTADAGGAGQSLLARTSARPQDVIQPSSADRTDARTTGGEVVRPELPPADKTTPAHAQAILGTWKQYSFGHRLLKVKDDGTATIDVKLDGFPALTIGEKFRIDIGWQIDGDELVFQTTGGEPKSSVNAVNALFGDKRVYQILEINDGQMLLQEGKEKKPPWDRVDAE
jgi:hypothetical protein